MSTTRELFEINARACADAVDRGSNDCFTYLANMIALVRIDSPDVAAMEADVTRIEHDYRRAIDRGEIVSARQRGGRT